MEVKGTTRTVASGSRSGISSGGRGSGGGTSTGLRSAIVRIGIQNCRGVMVVMVLATNFHIIGHHCIVMLMLMLLLLQITLYTMEANEFRQTSLQLAQIETLVKGGG